MRKTDQRSFNRATTRAITIGGAARQRVAVRVIAFPALLAAFATLVQIHDGISGKGNLWSALIPAAITAWWIMIAVYLSDRGGQ
jgi:hypothetical protein